MKKIFPLLSVVVLAFLAVGCANKDKSQNASVMDVAPVPPQEPAYAGPILAAPATPAYAEPAVTQTPVGGSAVGGSYTVKKGDTLYSIAKTAYGNGNQWQRIASANPGLSPATLKVGQTIMLP